MGTFCFQINFRNSFVNFSGENPVRIFIVITLNLSVTNFKIESTHEPDGSGFTDIRIAFFYVFKNFKVISDSQKSCKICTNKLNIAYSSSPRTLKFERHRVECPLSS